MNVHISPLNLNLACVCLLADCWAPTPRYGESRKFGFVGFRSEAAAAKALQYFNKTFIDTARLAVEFAAPVGSDVLARPWSKYSEGSSRFAHIHRPKEGTSDHAGAGAGAGSADASGAVVGADGVSTLEANVARMKDDAALREFLAIKKPRALAKVWANDDDQGLAASVVRAGFIPIHIS